MGGDLVMKFWRCYRCPRGFVHGRLLAAHLIDVHGEGAAPR